MNTQRDETYRYAEAQERVQSLGIKNSREYSTSSRQDSRLPTNPSRFYSGIGWIDWYNFLGTNKSKFYSTFSEAQAAASSLAVKSSTGYRHKYRRDAKLPKHPDVIYANNGWVNWYHFLGKERREQYPTYEEARTAVRALGIKTLAEYQRRYLEDRNLPACPHQYYAGAGWIRWGNFLGTEDLTYSEYADAQAAAIALGLTGVKGYRWSYKVDPRLPSNPAHTYKNKGWTGWTEFLGNTKRYFYTSYSDARGAAIALNLTTSDYKTRYLEDSKLPSAPNRTYAKRGWIGWSDFLGTEKRNLYPTYAEAQAAASALGIGTSTAYHLRYREDSSLPSYPESTYKKTGWVNWNTFLNTEKRNLYETYAEAQAGAKALGIRGKVDYDTRHFDDKRLPSSPNHCYADAGWTNWYAFLDNEKRDLYALYDDAQCAARSLNLKWQAEYKTRYQEDPKLPSSPAKLYAKSGWTNWYDYLGIDKPLDAWATFPLIWADVEKWLENETNRVSKIASLKYFLSEYYLQLGLPDDTRHLLFRSNPLDVEFYQQFIEAQADSRKKSIHQAITAFYTWALDEYCTDVDSDDRIVLPGCRNPFAINLAGYANSLGNYRPNQSTKAPLGYEYILRARKYLIPEAEKALLNQPKFTDLSHLQEFFNTRVDWMQIEERNIDPSDPNCIYRQVSVLRTINGKREKCDIYQIWSPVRFVALYTLLRFPLRGQQILWLDSGEADGETSVLTSERGPIRWEKNLGPLVGKGSKKRRPQAAVQRGSNDIPKMYITSNKTGRVDGGYESEWIPDDLVYWLLQLRDWQAKYNPISEPTPWLSLEGKIQANRKILKARGTQCFLFRTDGSGHPIRTKSAFENTLPQLLHKIQRDGEDLASLNYGMYGQKFITPYTPHSLRVSLITAYVTEGEAPVYVIAKLVGHTSLVMTIYYVKLSGERMRQMMGEAEKRAEKLVAERQAETIRRHGLHSFNPQLIVTDGNRFLLESDVPNTACVVFDCGICPVSASLCHIGGDLVVEREGLYGSVEAGYLGQKNCPRCRFFVTGVPFLGGMVALINEISLETHAEGLRYQRYLSEVDWHEQEHYDACQANKPDTRETQRKAAIANMQQSGAKLDGLLKDFVASNHYIQGSLKLIEVNDPDVGSEENIRLISAGGLREIGVAFEESKTQYHLLAEICQNATIYQSSNPSRALPLIAQAIDRMAENNHLKPAMFRLSDEQKLVVANELNRLLLDRMGSWERIDDLFAGTLMLLDIDAHEPQLAPITAEIQKLLSRASTRRLNEKDYPCE